MIIIAILLALAGVIGGWLLPRYWLSGENLTAYDSPQEPLFRDRPASPSHGAFEKELLNAAPVIEPTPKKQQLETVRRQLDEMGRTAQIISSVSPEIGAPVPGEWVRAPGADPRRRILYLHGGGFMVGSPQSHRAIISRFSEITGACVFAIDYRLTPEHPRLAAVADSQAAYRWILDNGPGGPEKLDWLAVAGDSAGGNLTLTTLAWARDEGLRAANAAVALSPATDSTMSSPSLRRNLDSDVMLHRMMAPLIRLPRPLLLWLGLLFARVRPSDPRVSPIFGDLSGLPPLLIHASNSETLEDDARRYVNKARVAGSPVRLQVWAHMMHVWHAFIPTVPEAEDAFEQIRLFLAEH